MARRFLLRASLVASVIGVFFLLVTSVSAVEIDGVQMYAMSQPQIYALLQRTPGTPLQSNGEFGFRAYYDTGASGVLLGKEVADVLGVNRATFNNTLVTYYDVGVGGSEAFDVSESLYVSLAPYQPDVNTEVVASYNQTFGALRAQIGRTDALFEPLNVLGMPVMDGKVVVMDPKPVEDPVNIDDMHTFVYNPGTPYSSTTPNNPGIPTTSHHVSLSYGAFDRFTTIEPAGAPGPTLHDNPFIGPDPVASLGANPPVDNTPGVTVTLGGQSSTGSFLFDTGAGASMISKGTAADLHIRYIAGSEELGDPLLESYDPAHPELAGTPLPTASQFQLAIGGIGESKTVAGFYLDSLVLPTQEAFNALNPNDPNNLRFLHAPVLVSDIGLEDPITHQTLTLDGVFGMNFMVASALISGGMPTDISGSAFDWMVFDEPNGVLGLDLKAEFRPVSVRWTGIGGTTWSTATGLNNWKDTSGTATNYTQNAFVTFDDTATGTTIDISAADVSPASVTFNNSSKNFTITGTKGIAGTTGVVKQGTGTVALNSVNTYTGLTTVQAGVLELGAGAQSPILTGGGADIQGGKLVFDYTTSDPAPTILSLLVASYNGGAWDIGKFRNSTADLTGLTLGWADDTLAKLVTVMATLAGDANLDGKTDATDLNTVLSFYNQTGTTWATGDFNYDGKTDATDLNTVLSYYNRSLATLGGSLLSSSQVPEPSALSLLAIGLLGLLAYACRKRK